MAIAVVILLLVVATLVFHFISPLYGWWFTDIASNWDMIDTTVDITFLVTGVVFVAVNLFLVYCLVKFRKRDGHKAEYDPENTKLESWLTIVTSIGVAAMLAPGLVVWGQFVTVPEDAAEFEAVGQQWHWSYRFPGEDGEFGNVDITHVGVDNPFGMDPEDPAGRDDVLVSNQTVHLPVDQPYHALLRSKDVLHDFAVPQFRVKMDLVPGMVTYAWFTPMRTGEYELLCEELCGLGHFAMRGRVVVDERPDFEAWLDAQPTYGELTARPEPSLTAGQAGYAVCAACHGPQGQGQQVLNAPKIAGLGAWYVERQLNYFKNGVRGTAEGDTYGATMAPMMATVPDENAIRNLAAYIESLPASDVEPTVIGNVARGERLFMTCAGCHGPDGSGIWSMNAPRLAGTSDWYLVTQLKHFQDRIRGTHAADTYGEQMGLMADILPDDQAINDVVAYINTLR
jgi:cytochrome c oxidase subunit 2